MAEGVKVSITDHAIISALNTPGGDIFNWRDEIGKEVKAQAEATAPVNNPMNAMHRGGEVGTYARSFDWDRRGSSGHHVVARITNSAAHAIYVEEGRSASYKMQIFSWTAWGGDIRRIGGPQPVHTRESLYGVRGDTRHHRYDRQLSAGELAFNERIGGLPRYMGSHTNARAGQHILRNALLGALGSSGISAVRPGL